MKKGKEYIILKLRKLKVKNIDQYKIIILIKKKYRMLLEHSI